jgi:hypothetical protein
MNISIKLIAVSAVVVAPTFCLAQAVQPLTRAQVRDQLIQLEKAGYQPGATDAYDYPHNLRVAEARVAAQNSAQATGYGSVEGGVSEAGGR